MKRISKGRAQAMYNAHKPFIMCASNLRPDVFGCLIDNLSFESTMDYSFDQVVNEFTYYNCINKETGRRAVFYEEV